MVLWKDLCILSVNAYSMAHVVRRSLVEVCSLLPPCQPGVEGLSGLVASTVSSRAVSLAFPRSFQSCEVCFIKWGANLEVKWDGAVTKQLSGTKQRDQNLFPVRLLQSTYIEAPVSYCGALYWEVCGGGEELKIVLGIKECNAGERARCVGTCLMWAIRKLRQGNASYMACLGRRSKVLSWKNKNKNKLGKEKTVS